MEYLIRHYDLEEGALEIQYIEEWFGEFRRRKTLMFNGYADEVAALYTGMDLKVNF